MRRNIATILLGAIIGTAIGMFAINNRTPVTVMAVERQFYDAEAIDGREVAKATEEIEEPTKRIITDGERDMLAAIIFAEAGNQDLDGKRLVADVVLNRVDSPKFPDNIIGVIFQKSQFWTRGLPEKFSEIPKECYTAVDMELEEQLNTEILYFRNNRYHSFGTPVLQHQNHYFSK